MIKTLVELGKQLSNQNRGKWDDIIDFPNVEKEQKNNMSLNVVNITFDLDKMEVGVEIKKEYEKQDCYNLFHIKVQGGNSKAIYPCVETGKIEQIYKSFFGALNDKNGKNTTKGHFLEAIENDFPHLSEKLFIQATAKIFALKSVFEEKYVSEAEKKGIVIRSLDTSKLFESLDLGKTSKVVLVCTSVICTQLGITESTLISELDGYEEFLQEKFLDRYKKEEIQEGQKSLCYATGEMNDNTIEAEFSARYSLNYVFVKETKNFATEFNKNNFKKNYQIGVDSQLYLSRASDYILKNLKTRIAGIDHCIIPQFSNLEKIDMVKSFRDIVTNNELLFGQEKIDELTTRIERKIDTNNNTYWISYIAFESDGNFFKVINEIKDVSKLHFINIIEKLQQTDNFFRHKLSYAVNWSNAMMFYDFNDKKFVPIKFNLRTINAMIPLKKDTKRNEVLALFKIIFENRNVDKNIIYKHFTDLILCHYYQRYMAYPNIQKQDNFDFAVRDSVFRYLALFYFLEQLTPSTVENQKNLENPEKIEPNASPNFGEKIQLFFEQMNYSPSQKAMFYLGRMLNTVVHLQEGKSKTVLDKVKFNGMDKDAIFQLSSALFEKAEQYKEVNKVLFSYKDFSENFAPNNWSMKSDEAVFFLLSGYSFGIGTPKPTTSTSSNNLNS